MRFLAQRFFKDESGATAIEYGLIAAGRLSWQHGLRSAAHIQQRRDGQGTTNLLRQLLLAL